MGSDSGLYASIVKASPAVLGYNELIGKPRKQAQELADKQAAAAAKAEEDQKSAEAQNKAALERDQLKNKGKADVITNGGRRGTLLTGSGGPMPISNGGGKTLLGS